MGRRETIQAEIRARGIQYLLHFTNKDNLPGIVEHGILSRNRLNELNLDAWGSREERLDGNDWATSVSIMHSDLKMFEAKRWLQPGVEWIFLVLDPSILWGLECHFHASNAASTAAKRVNHRSGSTTAFLKLFEDWQEYGLDLKLRSHREAHSIPDFLPTDPSAEVQVFDDIPPGCILGALVEREELAHSVQAELNRLEGHERTVWLGPLRDLLSQNCPIWDNRR